MDADAGCLALSTANVVADLTVTASSLEARISKGLAIQQLWIFTPENASGLMENNWHTWTLPGTNTTSWDNCHHILLKLHTGWLYWAVGKRFH